MSVTIAKDFHDSMKSDFKIFSDCRLPFTSISFSVYSCLGLENGKSRLNKQSQWRIEMEG